MSFRSCTRLQFSSSSLSVQEVDGAGGIFGLKLWTYRVLLELVHWADHAERTLHTLHTEMGGTEDV